MQRFPVLQYSTKHHMLDYEHTDRLLVQSTPHALHHDTQSLNMQHKNSLTRVQIDQSVQPLQIYDVLTSR